MTRPLLAALALALPLAGVIPALGQEAGTAAAGRKLALEVCASCHVVVRRPGPRACPQAAGAGAFRRSPRGPT